MFMIPPKISIQFVSCFSEKAPSFGGVKSPPRAAAGVRRAATSSAASGGKRRRSMADSSLLGVCPSLRTGDRIPSRMPDIERDGARIRYEVAGAGERAVLFAHNLFCDRSVFAAQAARLAGRRRTIAVDLRGHGESGPPPKPYGAR